MISIATKITLARIACIPFLVYAIAHAYWTVALWLFVIACLSDAVDGYVARLLNECTRLGQVLDPIADKLLITTSLTALVIYVPYMVPSWVVALVCMSQIALVVGGVLIYCTLGIEKLVPNKAGKMAMLVQSLLVTLILIQLSWSLRWHTITYIISVGSLSITLLAFLGYLQGALPWLANGRLFGR